MTMTDKKVTIRFLCVDYSCVFYRDCVYRTIQASLRIGECLCGVHYDRFIPCLSVFVRLLPTLVLFSCNVLIYFIIIFDVYNLYLLAIKIKKLSMF